MRVLPYTSPARGHLIRPARSGCSRQCARWPHQRPPVLSTRACPTPASKPEKEVISMSTESNVPVVIVGAGPTGVMLAIELARRGVEVRVFEKQTERSWAR